MSTVKFLSYFLLPSWNPDLRDTPHVMHAACGHHGLWHDFHLEIVLFTWYVRKFSCFVYSHFFHGSNIYVHRYKNMISQLQPPLHQLPPPSPAPLPPLAPLSASPSLSPRPCCGQPPLGPPPPSHLPHLRQSEVGTHGSEGAQFLIKLAVVTCPK